jgi:long-chain acyl-CoA synthetase
VDAKQAAILLNGPVMTSLRNNAALTKYLLAAMKKATKSFRKWEQVGDVYITLEPFAMVNGLLTQSYKVKRPAVMERYQHDLPV